MNNGEAVTVKPFFDAESSTFTYVIFETAGKCCAIIDSVLNFDHKSGRTSTRCADEVAAFVQAEGLTVAWLLETHVHADHLSGAPYLQAKFGGSIGIGEGIRSVHKAFSRLFMLPDDSAQTLAPFGRLFAPDEVFHVGGLAVRAMHVPGHTPADLAYVVEGAQGEPLMAFVGDTLFMPDVGSARCDFPGGCAKTLYASVRHLLAFPPHTRLFMCHDYPPAGRLPAYVTTVEQQRRHNVHVRDEIGEEEFVQMRRQRDATLAMPTLMLPAIQVNIRGGRLPPPQSNGVRYLQIPIDAI